MKYNEKVILEKLVYKVKVICLRDKNQIVKLRKQHVSIDVLFLSDYFVRKFD